MDSNTITVPTKTPAVRYVATEKLFLFPTKAEAIKALRFDDAIAVENVNGIGWAVKTATGFVSPKVRVTKAAKIAKVSAQLETAKARVALLEDRLARYSGVKVTSLPGGVISIQGAPKLAVVAASKPETKEPVMTPFTEAVNECPFVGFEDWRIASYLKWANDPTKTSEFKTKDQGNAVKTPEGIKVVR